jgi:hypothetical protein
MIVQCTTSLEILMLNIFLISSIRVTDTKQAIKIVGPDSSLSQVSMLTSEEKNDSNGSEFYAQLPLFLKKSFLVLFLHAIT